MIYEHISIFFFNSPDLRKDDDGIGQGLEDKLDSPTAEEVKQAQHNRQQSAAA